MFKVCLVDDMRPELLRLKNCVNWERLGVDQVDTAGNGQEALELVLRCRPDLIITDIRMPVMDGIEFVRQLRERGLGTRVIFLTGYDEMECIREAFRLSASDYILKPFSASDIEKAAREVLEVLARERSACSCCGRGEEKLLDRIFKEDAQPLEDLISRFCEKEGWLEESYRFSVVGLYGRSPAQAQRRNFFHAFPEVFYYIELPKLTLLLLRHGMDCRSVAGRMAQWLCAQEIGLNTAYLSGEVQLREARQVRNMFESAADAIFYRPEAEVLPLEALLTVRKAPELGEEENRTLRLLRRDMTTCLVRGNTGSLHEKLEEYWDICARGSAMVFREGGISLYYQINEELAAPDEGLANYCRQLRQGGKTIFQLVEEANNAGQIRRHMAWYVDKLLAWYRPLKENTNYRVAAFVEDYIREHYMEDISVEEIAAQIGLSTNYVRSIFKNNRGVTIQNYLLACRLEEACKLLRNTTFTVGKVGKMVGYNNVSYFCASFQKRYGKTPGEWRREQ